MTFGQLLKTQTFIALIASHCEFPGSWPGSIASNLITLEPGFPVHHLTAPEASMAWIPLPGEAVAFSSIPSRGYVRLAETKTCWVWMVLKCLESHKTSLLWFFDNHWDIGHHRISRSWTLHCHVTRFSQACCGPVDTAFLFDEFLRILRRVAMIWGSIFFLARHDGWGWSHWSHWFRCRDAQGRSLTTISYKHPQAITKAGCHSLTVLTLSNICKMLF